MKTKTQNYVEIHQRKVKAAGEQFDFEFARDWELRELLITCEQLANKVGRTSEAQVIHNLIHSTYPAKVLGGEGDSKVIGIIHRP